MPRRLLLTLCGLAPMTLVAFTAAADTPSSRHFFIVRAYTPSADGPSNERRFPLMAVGAEQVTVTSLPDGFSIAASCTDGSADRKATCLFEVSSRASDPQTLKLDFSPLLFKPVVVGRIERFDHVVREIAVLPVSKTEMFGNASMR